MLALQRLGRSMFGLALRDAAVALGCLASPAFAAALLASAIGFAMLVWRCRPGADQRLTPCCPFVRRASLRSGVSPPCLVVAAP